MIFIGIMNLGLWYFVRYSNYDDSSFVNSVVKHLLFALLYTLIWFLMSYILALFIIENDDEYTLFWQRTFGFKVLLSVLFYSIMIFFYNFVIYHTKNKETLQQQRDLELLLQKEELNSLKSQINPHFLFNSLNSISYLVYENADKAHEAIVKLSEF
jgi:sensor histidine kinase YesM